MTKERLYRPFFRYLSGVDRLRYFCHCSKVVLMSLMAFGLVMIWSKKKDELPSDLAFSVK